MVEKELIREREAEVQVTTHYDETLRRYQKLKREARTGLKVIKGNKIPFQMGRQGLVRWYATKHIEGLSLKTMTMFVHEIKVHSGQHRHQGGTNIFVLKGRGYSVVDGKRFDWSEGDLILLPFKKHGVVHQHFNLDDKPSRWLALVSSPMGEMVAGMMEQRVNHPDWKGK